VVAGQVIVGTVSPVEVPVKVSVMLTPVRVTLPVLVTRNE
jgi:hypothetical protein